MLSQTGYSKQIIGFSVEYLFTREDMLDDYYGQYTRLHLIKVADDIDCSQNVLDILSLDSNIYTSSQFSYIKRYQKFSKWIEANKGKKFIAIVPSYITNGSRFARMPEIYIYNKNFYFEKFQRGDNSICFITDCELIEVSKDISNKALLQIAHSIIMSKISQPFMDMDYQGRSVT